MDCGSDVNMLANLFTLLLRETNFAKEARSRTDCRGKLLDCSYREVYWGLQCGLSGNQAPIYGNISVERLKGNRCYGDISVSSKGNPA